MATKYIHFTEQQKEQARQTDIAELLRLPVREKIGRYKYTLEDQLDEEYESVKGELDQEIADALGREGF